MACTRVRSHSIYMHIVHTSIRIYIVNRLYVLQCGASQPVRDGAQNVILVLHNLLYCIYTSSIFNNASSLQYVLRALIYTHTDTHSLSLSSHSLARASHSCRLFSLPIVSECVRMYFSFHNDFLCSRIANALIVY